MIGNPIITAGGGGNTSTTDSLLRAILETPKCYSYAMPNPSIIIDLIDTNGVVSAIDEYWATGIYWGDSEDYFYSTMFFPRNVYLPAMTSISSQFAGGGALESVDMPACTTIGLSAFKNCTSLLAVSFPSCTTIGRDAFYWCTALTTASLPACTTIGLSAFSACTSLLAVSFPSCTTIGSNAFYWCTALTTASFPACTTIYTSVFNRCTRLITLLLTSTSVATLANSNAFTSTPIGGYSAVAGQYGSIYVPASLLASYKTATNWTYFSSRFVGV